MQKVIVYQIFTRLFGNRNTKLTPNGTLAENGVGKMADIDTAVLKRIKDMGVTHVWYTGVIRHATQTDYSAHGIPCQHPAVVKGRAGSPYAIADYYDIDPDIAVDVDHRMEEFEALVERTHRMGLKVVIDFVPNHVARQYRSIAKPEGVRDLGEDDNTDWHFSTSNNFYYCWGQPFAPSIDLQAGADAPYTEVPARATGNDQFTPSPSKNDWYETIKLNYGIDYCDAGGRSEHFSPLPDTWHKMTAILLFWAKKGVDVFRCDMAEMVPTAFWRWAIDKVRFVNPDIRFMGEVYCPALYREFIGAGFDWLYDKVGMYDCVRDVICGRRPAADITRQWQATDDILPHMLYFLENHDEQRVASPQFAGNAVKGVPGLVVSALLSDNPFMCYFGQEYGEPALDAEGFSGQDGRTTIFDYWSLSTVRRGYFDRRRLTAAERALFNTYQRVMNIATTERAVSEGRFFDLAYANGGITGSVYPFLRHADGETLLVVANFSDEAAADCPVVIPQHAFDFLGLPSGQLKATDLLSGAVQTLAFEPDQPIVLSIPANGAVVLKL